MAALFRAMTYATVFAGVLLIYLPARLLAWAGVGRPAALDSPQIAGMVITCAGVALALWCIASFALIGHGTPAPFDPPQKLVIRGPYRYVRNPMYYGGALALGGAALYYESAALAVFTAGFLLAAHLFILLYEEPVLRRKFGAEYEAYCGRVRRWRPGVGRAVLQ